MKIAASVTPNKTIFGPLMFPGALTTGIEKLSALGYDGIELSLRTSADIVQKDLFKTLEKNNMQLISIATGQSYVDDGFSLFAWEEDAREGAVSRIMQYIDLATVHNSTIILGGIKGRLDGPDHKAQYSLGIDAIKKCLEYAESKEIILLLESINRYESNIFNTLEDSARVAAEFKSDCLKILADTFHMNIEEQSIADSLDKYKKLIGVIHCADSNRLAPGMGHIDFCPVLSIAKEMPNLKYLGIEVLPIPESSICAEKAIKTIRKCILEV